jgi:hypothetical protein
MAKLNTVKVKADHLESGYMLVNESDFDKSKHELYGKPEKKAEPKKEPAKKSAKTSK